MINLHSAKSLLWSLLKICHWFCSSDVSELQICGLKTYGLVSKPSVVRLPPYKKRIPIMDFENPQYIGQYDPKKNLRTVFFNRVFQHFSTCNTKQKPYKPLPHRSHRLALKIPPPSPGCTSAFHWRTKSLPCRLPHLERLSKQAMEKPQISWKTRLYIYMYIYTSCISIYIYLYCCCFNVVYLLYVSYVWCVLYPLYVLHVLDLIVCIYIYIVQIMYNVCIFWICTLWFKRPFKRRPLYRGPILE